MKYNQITVVDLKKLEVCRYKVIDIVKKNIEDFPFFQGSLKKLGINLEDFYCNLDRKEFRITILKTLFPDYEVKDCQYGCYEKGHPDYKLCKDSEELFVEWKFNQDALRKSQVEWFIKNKDKNGVIIYLEEDVYLTEEEREEQRQPLDIDRIAGQPRRFECVK